MLKYYLSQIRKPAVDYLVAISQYEDALNKLNMKIIKIFSQQRRRFCKAIQLIRREAKANHEELIQTTPNKVEDLFYSGRNILSFFRLFSFSIPFTISFYLIIVYSIYFFFSLLSLYLLISLFFFLSFLFFCLCFILFLLSIEHFFLAVHYYIFSKNSVAISE